MAWDPKQSSPWGDDTSGPTNNGRGNRGRNSRMPNDFGHSMEQVQERIKRFFPNQGGGAKMIVILFFLGIAIWLATGFYRVQFDQEGIVMLFGKWVHTTGPGLNWYFPAPIGSVEKPAVTRANEIGIGYSGNIDQVRAGTAVDIPKESRMLSGDQNIADIDFIVFWKIKNAGDYLFNVRRPQITIKAAAESAMREVIGQSRLDDALVQEKSPIQNAAKKRMQEILDSYAAGVDIIEVQLLRVDPPADVIDAFNEVQRARQDKARKVNEAETYRNRILPRARGAAAQIVESAKAYKEEVIKKAEGEAKRFQAVYDNYRLTPEVTKKRLYLETMEKVLKDTKKVIIDPNAQNGQGVVPYLPLDTLKTRPKVLENTTEGPK